MKELSKGLLAGAMLLSSAFAGGASAAAAEPTKQANAGELTGLDRLLAMEDMKNLRLTFCRSLDNRNFEALRSTMADDYELYFAQTQGPGGPDVRPPVVVHSADDFVNWFKMAISAQAGQINDPALQGSSIHICVMPQFETVTANSARALWFINGSGGIGGQALGLGFERVVEDYVKINGKWLIKKSDARVEAQGAFQK